MRRSWSWLPGWGGIHEGGHDLQAIRLFVAVLQVQHRGRVFQQADVVYRELTVAHGHRHGRDVVRLRGNSRQRDRRRECRVGRYGHFLVAQPVSRSTTRPGVAAMAGDPTAPGTRSLRDRPGRLDTAEGALLSTGSRGKSSLRCLTCSAVDRGHHAFGINAAESAVSGR